MYGWGCSPLLHNYHTTVMQQKICSVTLSAIIRTKAGQPQSQGMVKLFLNDEQCWSLQVSQLGYEGNKNIHFHNYS